MVEKQLKSITFPGINESYFIPDSFVAKDEDSDGHIEFLHYIPEQNVVQIDKSLNVGGAAAEAAATGQRFRDMETLIGNMSGQGDFVAPVLSVNGKTGTVDLSATDIGAAPAGYVSERGFAATYAEWYEGIQRVFSEMPDNSKKVVSFGLGAAGEIPRGSWLVELNRFYAEYGFIKIRNETYPDGIILSINYTWGGWEWVNPPMLPSVEYRTTERYNGKPVYTIVIDCGAIPNDSSKSVAHGISGITQVLRTTGTRVGSGGDSVPSWYWDSLYGTPVRDNMEEIGVMGSTLNIYITSVKYSSTETLTVQMWYVK